MHYQLLTHVLSSRRGVMDALLCHPDPFQDWQMYFPYWWWHYRPSVGISSATVITASWRSSCIQRLEDKGQSHWPETGKLGKVILASEQGWPREALWWLHHSPTLPSAQSHFRTFSWALPHKYPAYHLWIRVDLLGNPPSDNKLTTLPAQNHSPTIIVDTIQSSKYKIW